MTEYVKRAAQLTTNYISTRSMAIVVRDRVGNATPATSICIQVGSHHLLATAGHVIEDMNDDRLQLIPAGELSRLPVPFATRSCSPGRSAPASDLAWIELDPAVARDHRLRFLGLNDIRPHESFDRQHPYLLHGYPHDSAILTATTSDVESTLAFTMIAEDADIPRKTHPREIALEYPPRDAAGRPMTAPDAYGFSGGGVWWHPRHDDGLVSSPERLRLVAINTTWDKTSSILFGTRIESWLALVHDDFPDTRALVAPLLSPDPNE